LHISSMLKAAYEWVGLQSRTAEWLRRFAKHRKEGTKGKAPNGRVGCLSYLIEGKKIQRDKLETLYLHVFTGRQILQQGGWKGEEAKRDFSRTRREAEVARKDRGA